MFCDVACATSADGLAQWQHLHRGEPVSGRYRSRDAGPLVRDAADRSKLLALDPAIESTRAGEHGSGFVLVVDVVARFSGLLQR